MLDWLTTSISAVIAVLIGVSTVVLSFFTYTRVITGREPRDEQEAKKFHQTLLSGLKTGAIVTMADLSDIYRGIFGLGAEDLSYRYGMSRQLRIFMVELISKNIDKSIDDQTIVEWKNKISEFIRVNEEVAPYADLPPAERNIVRDTSVFLKAGDTEAAGRKLNELAAMIQVRNDDLNRIRNTNRWSVPLSIVGMVLTIVFGLIALLK